MKIRILIEGHISYCQNIPLGEVKTYIDLLRSYNLMDQEGDLYKVDFVSFDVHQNAIDVGLCECGPDENNQ